MAGTLGASASRPYQPRQPLSTKTPIGGLRKRTCRFDGFAWARPTNDRSVPGAKFLDVTDLIIEPFGPDENTKRVIRELRDKPPVPLEKIEKHHDH